jgi:flagellar assembly protein FliH
MMTSLSDDPEVSNYLPGELSGFPNEALGKKNISRLEFQALDHPVAQAVQELEVNSASTATELCLHEQVTALQEQLKLQTQQFVKQLEAAQREARSESREEWSEELETAISAERARVLGACEKFEKERSQYFSEVEFQVVKLALAIAARVLHREVKIDSLLLTATVRIALEKVAGNSITTLRVPAADLVRWQGVFVAGSSSELQLIGDDEFESGECVLDTTVGRVDLGVTAQLEEIEKGFFDLLQQRPA